MEGSRSEGLVGMKAELRAEKVWRDTPGHNGGTAMTTVKLVWRGGKRNPWWSGKAQISEGEHRGRRRLCGLKQTLRLERVGRKQE